MNRATHHQRFSATFPVTEIPRLTRNRAGEERPEAALAFRILLADQFLAHLRQQAFTILAAMLYSSKASTQS
jgi:hypothetical protein